MEIQCFNGIFLFFFDRVRCAAQKPAPHKSLASGPAAQIDIPSANLRTVQPSLLWHSPADVAAAGVHTVDSSCPHAAHKRRRGKIFALALGGGNHRPAAQPQAGVCIKRIGVLAGRYLSAATAGRKSDFSLFKAAADCLFLRRMTRALLAKPASACASAFTTLQRRKAPSSALSSNLPQHSILCRQHNGKAVVCQIKPANRRVIS